MTNRFILEIRWPEVHSVATFMISRELKVIAMLFQGGPELLTPDMIYDVQVQADTYTLVGYTFEGTEQLPAHWRDAINWMGLTAHDLDTGFSMN